MFRSISVCGDIDGESSDLAVGRCGEGVTAAFRSSHVVTYRNLLVAGPEDWVAVAVFRREGCTGSRSGGGEADGFCTVLNKGSLLLARSENQGCRKD